MKDIIFNLIYKINIPENDLFRMSALFLCSFIIVFLILVLIKGDFSFDEFKVLQRESVIFMKRI